MGIVVLVLLVGLLVAGLWLLLAGLRGDRVPEHTVCRGCRFDLRGVEPVKCPECGADLSAPRAMALVRRRRNPRRAWIGVVLTLLALAAPVALLIDAAASGRLSAHLPTPVLALELRLMGDRTPASVTNELIKRCGAGEVSDSTLRTVALAITRMRSGDESLSPALNALVGDAAAKGLISKDVMAEHVVVPRMLEVAIAERINEGDSPISALINVGDQSRLPLDGVWTVSRRIVAVEVNGIRTKSLPETRERRWTHTYRATPNTIFGAVRPGSGDVPAVPVQPVLAPGRHTVRLHQCVEVFHGAADVSPGVFHASLDFEITVLPKGESLVQLVEDDRLRRAFAEMLSPYLFRAKAVGGGGTPTMSDSWSIGINSGAKSPPRPMGVDRGARVGGAWDINFEIDGRREKVGAIKIKCTTDRPAVHTWHNRMIALPKDAGTVRMVLTPNIPLATQREAIDVMPAGEIVLDAISIH